MPEMVRVGLDDPLLGFNFIVTFPQRGVRMGFTRITGLDVRMKPYEYIECSEMLVPRKLPDVLRFGDVGFERGVAEDGPGLYSMFYDLAKSIRVQALNYSSPPSLLRLGTIFVHVQKETIPSSTGYRASFAKVATIYEAIPTAFEFGPLSAGESKVLVQRLTVSNEGIEFFPLASNAA